MKKRGLRHKTTNILNSLKQQGCINCGDMNVTHIEFDHVNPESKIERITVLVDSVKFYDELHKIQPMCSVCHLHKTNKELRSKYPNMSERTRKLRELITTEKMKRGECSHCKLKVLQLNPFTNKQIVLPFSFFEFDHIDPSTKYKSVCMIKNIKRLQSEMQKCRLLCRYCHKQLTYNK